MSDQDSKPESGVETSAETPAPAQTQNLENPDVQTESDLKNEDSNPPDARAAEDQKASDAPTVDKDDAKDSSKDSSKDETKDNPKDNSKDNSKDDAKDDAKDETKPDAKKDIPSIDKPPQGMLRVNRRGHEARQKSNASVLPESDDPDAIRKQVEFYFGDSNLPDDKFLWGKVEGTQNKPVPISLICEFSRMRRFKPYAAVVDALKASKLLVVEGAEGEETIRRKFAYKPAEDKRTQIDERSTYTKGFGEEQASTQFDIEAFFAQYGQFNSVRLRRVDVPEKTFKGSVFVEWADKETAEKFMALDPKPTWNGHPLLIMWKRDYTKQKTEAIREGKINMSGNWNNYGRSNRGNRGGRPGRGRGHHNGLDVDDWKKRREEDQRTGFNNRRGSRDQHGRGRGRGRGRGNSRGQDKDRAENGSGSAAKEEQGTDSRDVGPPKIHVSKQGRKITKEKEGDASPEVQTNGKRAREEDTASEAPPAKKVDSKDVAEAA
ncbi:hypothetical protein GGS23DRAFT_551098 [Durotheca rogersii]|uniref:uncharacterized protein n=1 Tax=Durotheca rogersii TaxID=419775 RepID=UPI00221FBA66|nr:uncharacterized protein GGS23DRAFT_551098 [Durotheca rogersii]KAI5866560.1 hypothetical protein GGS23DRAFT_551098 [Durotheca rogersii]